MNNIGYIVSVIWRFLSELSGVVASILLILTFAFLLIKTIVNNPVLLLVALPLFILATGFLLRNFKRSFEKLGGQLEKEKIEKEISSKETRDKTIDMDKINLDKILPSNRQLMRWDNYARRRASHWDSDAYEESFNMYIDVSPHHGTSFTIQILFVSDWKNEVLTIYLSTGIGFKLTLQRKGDIFMNHTNPVFTLCKNWQWAVKESYDKVRSKLTGGAQLRIHFHQNDMSVLIEYTYGKVDCRESFYFDSKTLRSSNGFSKIFKGKA
jgi:hypothetical protein